MEKTVSFNLILTAGLSGIAVFCFIYFLSGCSYAEGYSVESYLKKVAEIQHSSDESLLDLNDDIKDLGTDKAQEAISRLKSERDAIEQAKNDIDNLEAPQSSEQLKEHLLNLYAQGEDVINSLILEGNYHLAMAPLLDQYDKAAKDFSAKIKSSTSSEDISQSLNAYTSSIENVVASASKLQPSVLSLKTHERFVANLITLKDGLGSLSAALVEKDKNKIEEATNKLNEISAGNQAFTDQLKKDRETGAQAYNAKITKMSELMAQIRQDELDLHEQFDKK